MRKIGDNGGDAIADTEGFSSGTRWVAWIGAICFWVLVIGFVAYAFLTAPDASSQFSSVGSGSGFGRPIRRRGRRVRPAVADTRCCTVGDVWIAAAAEEAASVTAFIELADRLDAIGAPPTLVQRCIAAAEDEVRHTRMCRRIAQNLGASLTTRTASPPVDALPGPPAATRARRLRRQAELVRLGVESFVDGVVGEGIAAQHLAAGSATALAGIDAPLRSMAADEARHAELGADIVQWCLGESPQVVGAALLVCARQMEALGGRGKPASPPHREQIARHELQRAGLVDSATAAAIGAARRFEASTWFRHTSGARSSDGGRSAAL